MCWIVRKISSSAILTGAHVSFKHNRRTGSKATRRNQRVGFHTSIDVWQMEAVVVSSDR